MFKYKVWVWWLVSEGGSFKGRKGSWNCLELPKKKKKKKELVGYCLQITGVLFLRLEKVLESTTVPEKTHEGLIGFLGAFFRLAEISTIPNRG